MHHFESFEDAVFPKDHRSIMWWEPERLLAIDSGTRIGWAGDKPDSQILSDLIRSSKLQLDLGDKLLAVEPGIKIGLGTTIGNRVIIGQGNKINLGVRIGDNVKTGRAVSVAALAEIGPDVTLGFATNIGRRSKIGPGCDLQHAYIRADVVVGANVKIHKAFTTVLPGARIGDNVEIGGGALVEAGAIVPPNTVIPARTAFTRSGQMKPRPPGPVR